MTIEPTSSIPLTQPLGGARPSAIEAARRVDAHSEHHRRRLRAGINNLIGIQLGHIGRNVRIAADEHAAELILTLILQINDRAPLNPDAEHLQSHPQTDVHPGMKGMLDQLAADLRSEGASS